MRPTEGACWEELREFSSVNDAAGLVIDVPRPKDANVGCTEGEIPGALRGASEKICCARKELAALAQQRART